MTEEDKARDAALEKAQTTILDAELLFPLGDHTRAKLYDARCIVGFQLAKLRGHVHG